MELGELEKPNPSFKLIATMDQMENPAQICKGETGSIDAAMLKRHLSDLQSAIFYISGPPAMITAMRKLLTGVAVNENNIKTEEFTGY